MLLPALRLRHSVILAWPLAAAVGGCLPIPITYVLSPPVVGVYRRADGTPLPGARIAISTEYWDSSCVRPALETLTDSVGGFELSSAKLRQHFILLLPFDRAAPNYRFCASVADTLQPVFHGWARSTARPDSLTCIQLADTAPTRVTCSGWLDWIPAERKLIRR